MKTVVPDFLGLSELGISAFCPECDEGKLWPLGTKGYECECGVWVQMVPEVPVKRVAPEPIPPSPEVVACVASGGHYPSPKRFRGIFGGLPEYIEKCERCPAFRQALLKNDELTWFEWRERELWKKSE